MTPEKRVQNQIINYIKSLKQQGLPIYVERRQAGGFSYKMGQADLYVVFNGLHIEIEVKRPGGQLRPMQEKWKQSVENFGGLYLCADDIEQVKTFFEKLQSKLFTFK